MKWSKSCGMLAVRAYFLKRTKVTVVKVLRENICVFFPPFFKPLHVCGHDRTEGRSLLILLMYNDCVSIIEIKSFFKKRLLCSTKRRDFILRCLVSGYKSWLTKQLLPSCYVFCSQIVLCKCLQRWTSKQMFCHHWKKNKQVVSLCKKGFCEVSSNKYVYET